MPELNRRQALQLFAAATAGAVAATLPASATADTVDGPTTVLKPDPEDRGPAVSRMLTGVNNNLWFDDSQGLWDSSTHSPNPDVVAKTGRAGIGLVRYPGGTSANLFNWKGAIGPEDQRSCQVDGRGNSEPVDSRYGPDEHMQFVHAVAAQAQIMVGFAGTTAADAADWVAYMNAPQGTPWGDKRAANGHPEPYGVRYWEIGNEHDRVGERYWLSADTDTAIRQYAFGGSQRQTGQPVGTECDHRPSAAVSDGSPGQRFRVWFPPVVPGSQAVIVDGITWQPIDRLDAAGPDDEVYVIDPATGWIGFGDGNHGRIPPEQSQITADYDSGPHDGFIDFYAAMKAVDPDIDVLATWAPITAETGRGGVSFPQLMAEHGHGADYDGMTIHPYTNFARDFGITGFTSEASGHDDYMLGEAAATTMVEQLIAEVRQYGSPDAYVAVSEFGALWFGSHDATVYPHYDTAMSHVLYMASQWAHFATLGLPWAEGNALISSTSTGLRAVLGGQPGFVYTAEAVVRQQLQPFVAGGGHVVGCPVIDNVTVPTASTPLGSSYPALVATAAVDQDDDLIMLVVNRSVDQQIQSQIVVPQAYGPRVNIRATVVSGSAFDDYNSADHPDDVQIRPAGAGTETGSIAWSFAAHSVTLLQLTAAE